MQEMKKSVRFSMYYTSIPFFFVEIYNNDVIFTYQTSIFVVVLKTILLCFFYAKDLYFCDFVITTKLKFFLVLHFNWILVFLLKYITKQLFPSVRLHFLQFFEKLYKFYLFHLFEQKFCGFERTTCAFFFPCITPHFNFFCFCGNL